MDVDIDLLQVHWLFLMPLPWLWLYWRFRDSKTWPRILPILNMRFPVLDDFTDPDTAVADISEPGRKKKTHLFFYGYNDSDHTMAIALSFMLLALAQPVSYEGEIEQQKADAPVDLILVIDTALSMSLKDYEIEGQFVSRLALSQIILNNFIQDFSGSRLGLVVLGNPSAIWLPLTNDRTNVQHSVTRLSTLLAGRISNMGAALNLIQKNFTERSIKNKKKIIVLISDGGTQIGAVSPKDAAQELASQGFILNVIAVGSSDPDAGSLDNSNLIYEAVNLNMLQQVSEFGNGQLYHALDPQTFKEALFDIEHKYRQPAHINEKKKLTQAWYPLPLLISMLLILIAVFFHQDNTRAGR